jgi:hypothetical protein
VASKVQRIIPAPSPIRRVSTALFTSCEVNLRAMKYWSGTSWSATIFEIFQEACQVEILKTVHPEAQRFLMLNLN